MGGRGSSSARPSNAQSAPLTREQAAGQRMVEARREEAAQRRRDRQMSRQATRPSTAAYDEGLPLSTANQPGAFSTNARGMVTQTLDLGTTRSQLDEVLRTTRADYVVVPSRGLGEGRRSLEDSLPRGWTNVSTTPRDPRDGGDLFTISATPAARELRRRRMGLE